MLHIEACIKMLDPTYNLARITVKRRKANGLFKRGTLYKHALDVLRSWPKASCAASSGTPARGFKTSLKGSRRSGGWPLNRKFNGHWRVACPYQSHADVRHFLPDFGLSFPHAGAIFLSTGRIRPLANAKQATEQCNTQCRKPDRRSRN
jgi:hypothetical protein